MQQTNETKTFELSPQLSALEASLASLEPAVQPGSREAAKSAVLLRLLESPPPLSGEKLIETIVRSDDREITLSLKEYVKSAEWSAGIYGTLFGLFGGLLLGLCLGIALTNLLTKAASPREVHHVPYFIDMNAPNGNNLLQPLSEPRP